ncbi:MAG: hypothetical protein ACR2JY_04760 [Chloroflexota bacterium]
MDRQDHRSAQPAGTAYATYGAAVLFAVSLARFFFIPRLGLPAQSVLLAELNAGLLPIAAHLLLFPLVAALPAPSWARAAGYGWLVIDMASDIMALNSVPDATYLPLRYGGHVAAALWIAAAGWQAKGALRIVGLLLAINLGGYSLIPHASYLLLLPTGPLLPIWFVLAGRRLARPCADQPLPLGQPDTLTV